MKKFLVGVLVICFISICFCGCGDENNTKNTKSVDYISLDTSNCYYYLSIKDTLNGVNGVNSNPIREIEIHGAVNGVYSDCVLDFEYGSFSSETGTKQIITVELNAAGFTSFTYTYNRNVDGVAKLIGCSGKLYLDGQKFLMENQS